MNIKITLKTLAIILFLSFFQKQCIAQISTNETPISFSYALKDYFPTIDITPPNINLISKQDSIAYLDYKPLRFEKIIDCNIDFINKAVVSKVRKGKIYRLAIHAKDARAISLYYNKFIIPEKGKLFIYNAARDFVKGAYTHNNNTSERLYASELIRGDKIIIEYFMPDKETILPQIIISGIGYAYRGVDFLEKGFGDAGDCEINVNCTEGSNWQNQKRGVVRILIRAGNSGFWCTGSVINNTRQNFDPYLLTADHCAGNATASDLEQWVFYFNYETDECQSPILEPQSKTIVGAQKVANGGHEATTGSDFYLMLLNRSIPSDYNTYYNGWSREETPAQKGVCIHHPQGDIKKISTYTTPLTESQYNGNGVKSHWKVYWSMTDNGLGVTEGGSSGSPLFNNDGLIVGTLTGGWASCSTPNQPDFYGKFSWSWDKNGSTPQEQLKQWLDPSSTGITTLQGLGGTPNFIKADFICDTVTIKNKEIEFFNMSVGDVDSWQWTFEGGIPETSIKKNPSILYKNYGKYDVSLIVKGPAGCDTLIKKNYISIIANVFPIPTTTTINIEFGKNPSGIVHYTLFNTINKVCESGDKTLSSRENLVLDVNKYPSGIYFLEVDAYNEKHIYKMIILKQE